MTKKLLTVTALIEGGTGLLLIAAPSWIVALLLGAESLDAVALTLVRIAGAAIFSLAVACWFSRQGELAAAIVKAMLFYNISVASILAYGSFASDLGGIGLWPVIGGPTLFSLWVAWFRFEKEKIILTKISL